MKIPQLPNIEIADQDLGCMTWYDAMEICPKGWRLPTQRELMIIWASLPKEELIKYGFEARYYWSSTEYTTCWYVNFDNGHTNDNAKTFAYYVRCVRDITNSTTQQSVSKQDVLDIYRKYLIDDIESKVERLKEIL